MRRLRKRKSILNDFSVNAYGGAIMNTVSILIGTRIESISLNYFLFDKFIILHFPYHSSYSKFNFLSPYQNSIRN